MIIINPNGGFGNQLFNYAAGLSLSKRFKTTIRIDLTSIQRNAERHYKFLYFKIIGQNLHPFKKKLYLHKLFTHIPFIKTVVIHENKDWWTCPGILKDPAKENIYLNGVYPFPEFYMSVRKELQEAVKLKPEFYNHHFNEINQQVHNTVSVSVHVRRGDYQHNDNKRLFNELNSDYYNAAFAYVKARLKHPVFYLFTDDKELVPFDFGGSEFKIVSGATELEDHHEFELMKACKHSITANSTFSWWAAYLGDHPDKIIIMPKTWYVKEEAQAAYENNSLLYNPAAIKI